MNFYELLLAKKLGGDGGGGGITPTGTKSITTNGIYDVTNYASADVNVIVSEPEDKGVNFYDYNGTLLYSYTAEEFLQMDAMPPNPSHDKLTAQGWNWSLTDAKQQVQYSGVLNIGQIYIPTDEQTHFFISVISETARPIFCLRFGQTVSNGIVVDWGDGSIETITGTSVSDHVHTYQNAGNYEIKLKINSGSIVWNTTNGNSLLGADNSINWSTSRAILNEVWLGKGIININTGGSANWLIGSQSLKAISIPEGVTQITGVGMVVSSIPLPFVAFPKSITSISCKAVRQDYCLKTVSLPKGLSSLYESFFEQCYALQKVVLPTTITSIGNKAFYRANALSKLIVPENVTSIGSEVFYQCYSLKELHLKRMTPPTLSNTNSFTGVASDLRIFVPYSADHSILNAYKTATNWSSFASKMEEEQ